MLWELHDGTQSANGQSGGGLELLREQGDLNKWHGIGFGGTGLSGASLDVWMVSLSVAGTGLMSKVSILRPSSFSASIPSLSSTYFGMNLYEYVGCVQAD